MSKEYFKKITLGIDYVTTQSVSSVGKTLDKAFENSSVGKIIAAGFGASMRGQNPLKATFDAFLVSFGNTLSSAIDRMSTILSYSQMTDANVRDLKLSYGFSSSQAYGYQTAMDVMGFSSMDDLMYANSQQRQQFNHAFTKFSDYYTELYDSGFFTKLQEYQFDMKMFKLEMEHELISFFMDNKDTIMNVMQGLMTVSEKILSFISVIVDLLGENDTRTDEERMREVNSIMNSYSNKSTNINISNDFTNIQKGDTSWLANAGAATYRQVINYFDKS